MPLASPGHRNSGSRAQVLYPTRHVSVENVIKEPETLGQKVCFFLDALLSSLSWGEQH